MLNEKKFYLYNTYNMIKMLNEKKFYDRSRLLLRISLFKYTAVKDKLI